MIELSGNEGKSYVIDVKSNKVMKFWDFIQKRGQSHQNFSVTKYNSEYEAKVALRKKLEKDADTLLGSLAEINYTIDHKDWTTPGCGDLGDD